MGSPATWKQDPRLLKGNMGRDGVSKFLVETYARTARPERLRGVRGLSIEARYIEDAMPHELDQTYRRTFARLKGLFRARGCTPEEAADLAQEAAMRAYMHVRRWGVSGDGLDPLINRIARNLLIDRHRRVTPYLVSLDNAEEVSDPAADPTAEIIRRQEAGEVHTAVNELPTRHRTALLYSMNGMTPAEVGDQLGIGRNAADALLHRARRSLRDRLSHMGEGALGVGIWFRIRTRNAAGRVGLGAPVEAIASASVSASVAAAAAVVAIMQVFGAPASAAAAGSVQTGYGRSATIAAPVNGAASVAGQSATGSTGRGGRAWLMPRASVSHDAQGVHGDTSVPNPVKPGESVLGVAPDVGHDRNAEQVVVGLSATACQSRMDECSDPPGPSGGKR